MDKKSDKIEVEIEIRIRRVYTTSIAFGATPVREKRWRDVISAGAAMYR